MTAVPEPSEARLCEHHGTVIRNLAEKDHVDDRESDKAAIQLARQCCQWRLR